MIYREKHPGERCFSYLVINQKYKIMQDTEIWKDIPSYKGYYQVSNQGRVRSVTRSVLYVQKNRFFFCKRIGRILSTSRSTKGYRNINLTIGGKCLCKKVHRLVAIAFIPNPKNKPQINHKNGIKHDNDVTNLEWCTQSENTIHSFAIGLQVPRNGENIGTSKLTNNIVIRIRNLYGSGKYTQYEIAEMFCVTQASISGVVLRKTWTHI